MLGNCKKGVSLRATSVNDEGAQTNQCHFQALIYHPSPDVTVMATGPDAIGPRVRETLHGHSWS